MFYWTVGGRQIVLTDAEEHELMHRAGLSASERISSLIVVGGKPSPLQATLGKFLEDYAARDPEQFELEYVRRSGTGPEHSAELRALIDAFAGTTGRLEWGAPSQQSWSAQLGPSMWMRNRPDVISLTILHPVRRFFRRRLEVVGQISFPSAEIERFYGTDSSLFIATSRLVVRASDEFVQVIQTPDDESDAPWRDEA
ncbi:MAG: hypothetical protein KF689_03510 [Gemmatimonadaceae bacterium]|nr:hypothetical protein [Gemmatimonadaceae bacterium]